MYNTSSLHKYQTPSNIDRKHTCISKSNQTIQATNVNGAADVEESYKRK